MSASMRICAHDILKLCSNYHAFMATRPHRPHSYTPLPWTWHIQLNFTSLRQSPALVINCAILRLHYVERSHRKTRTTI